MFQITGIQSGHNKTVKYFNVTLDVPSATKYITTNLYGDIQCWTERPSLSTYRWHGDNWYDIVATIRYTGDWRESLQEVE